MIKLLRINEYERGLVFRDRAFRGILAPGRHWVFDPFGRTRIDRVSMREPWLAHADLDVIVKSGALAAQAEILDLKDHERALVWLDGRFRGILGPGAHAIWTVIREVRVEVIDARVMPFIHAELPVILKAPEAARLLVQHRVEQGHVALLFVDGRFALKLEEGLHVFWVNGRTLRFAPIDLRRRMLDITGQEIMTADLVTLRLNAVVTLRVTDAERFGTASEDACQAIYREAQLALRELVGTRTLDELLAAKDGVAAALEVALRARAGALGIEILALGIRDIILPGEMKELLNKVTEARKAAEAALITRREETATVRSQANTARLFESNPTLMRLRELEVLEKVAEKSNLTVMLGEQGLTDRVVKLL